MNNESLPYLSSEGRLNAYNLILQGCSHVWSKNELQKEKALAALHFLIPLTQSDPIFLAHLTSYALRKTKNKDLQVLTTFVNSLSSGDGTPFSPGSEYTKPNLRIVSAAAVQMLDPKLALRVAELSELKFGMAHLREARHFSRGLRTALERYLLYREANLEIIKGIKKAGLSGTLKKMYEKLHQSPSDEVAAILRWQQRDHHIEFAKPAFEFDNLSDLEIAEKIQKEKLPVLGVLGALPRQMSPVVAVALLEQATGNQAVILRKTFEDAGVLKDPEVMKLFEEKIATAKTALDRVETLTENASEAVKQAMVKARSEVRKEEMAGLGKIFMHIDFSGSMDQAIEFAKERGAIIAECVNNPEENFRWGLFGTSGRELPLPKTFVKDAFKAELFGLHPNGGTNCFALYPNARQFGADIDVFVTDQGHNYPGLGQTIREYHEQTGLPKPKACVIVNFRNYENRSQVKDAYEENGIPVAILTPESLTESALVVQAVKEAMKGPLALIDEVMETELLTLPEWYSTL